MSKIELDNIASGYNLGKINANFVKIEEALDNKVLFRDNTSTPTEPNQMEQAIDMNGNSLLNLPVPTDPTNPVRLQDIDITVADITALDGRVTTLEEGTAGDSRYIHWLYNNGSATGGETTINIPYTFTSVATVFVNGVRMTYGLAFDYDVAAKIVTFTEALEATDEVVVSLGTEPVQDYSDLVTDVQLAAIQDITKPYIFATVATYKAFNTTFPVGKLIHLKDRNAKFTVITGTTTANDKSILSSNSLNQSIEIIKTRAMNVAMFGDENDVAVVAFAVQYIEDNDVNILQGNNVIKRGNATNMLIQSAEDNQPNRIHQEPKNNIDSGTVTKYDWMFDPYESNPVDYRIFNIVTQTGDPFGTGEGAITSINAKGVGNTWGLWPSIQFGFQDLGADAVCSKMWYGDHMQPQHFTPNKGNWRTGKVVVIGDNLTNNNDIFIAASAGICGSTPPTHTSGTVSDGVVDWTFTYSPAYQTVRATHMFGDRSDMPVLGHPNARTQFLKDYLIGWGANGNYLDVDGAIVASIKAASTSGGANKWLHIETSGGGYKRFSQDQNWEQNIGSAMASQVLTSLDLVTSIDVSGMTTLRFDNSGSTAITNFTGGVSGQRLRLVSTNTNTSITHSTLTNGGVIKNVTTLSIAMNANGALDLERDISADFWRVVGVGY